MALDPAPDAADAISLLAQLLTLYDQVDQPLILCFLSLPFPPCIIPAAGYLEHFTHRFHSVLSTESLNDPILQTPLGWYKPNGIRENKPRNHTPVMCARLVKALRCLIEQYPDVMTVPDVANLTGYHRESSSTVCCNR